MISSLENISEYYNHVKSLNDILISYLNIEENSKELLDISIDEKYIEKNTDFNSKLLRELIECDKFNLTSYSNLVKKNGYHYEDIDLSKLEEEKINILVNDDILEFGNINFELLKANSENQHIVFLENNINELIEGYSDFLIDSDDIIGLLESKNISVKNKEEVIELLDYDLIDTPKIAKLIYSYINKTIKRPNLYIKNMVLMLDSIESKVNLLVEQESELTNQELIEILELMPHEYNKIAKLDGKHTLLPNKDYNRRLIKILDLREFITSNKLEKKNQIRLIIKNK